MNSNTINDSMTMPGGGTGAVLANRYRVLRQLGQGGMGSVWLAEDTQLDNKQFAIKMLPSILVSNKRAYSQLKAEALVAMKLTHPNIVTLRAFEENNGNPFLVMDYIDGQTLDDYLAEKGKLTEEETIRILRPIAAALDYAHGEGVVHRDVKPANVMIRKDGHPFILDFGIAREIQETLTRVTGKLSSGTLLYMSPEQLHGASPKKGQDIYSFAAMAYECLKGEPPFSRGQIEYQIDNDLPEPINFPSVMSGLAKKPENRPQTCSAVLAGGKGFSHKERKERKGGGAWKLILAMLVLGFAAVGGWWYYNQQKQEAARIAAAQRARAEAERKAEEERKAAEEAKRKADEERKAAELRRAQEEAEQRAEEERKAKEEAKRKAEEERLEAAHKTAATEIRLEAKVQQGKVSRISSEDGFKARKDALEDVYSRAEALFDEKIRRWNEAAHWFSNYVTQCEALIGLDGERQTAVASRTKADRARNEAVEAEAEKYAATLWGDAEKMLESARVDFGNMLFVSATRLFSSAAEQFGKCVDEAKSERERQEDAKQKAEQEARERERRANWRQEGRQFTINEPYGLNMTMKWCPAGTFTMGSPTTEEGRCDDETQHQVTLTKGFWMGETEVTQGQWKKIMDGETVVDLARKGLQDDTVYNIAGKQQTLRELWKMARYADPKNKCGDVNDDVPVYHVNWNEAAEFCRRLTQRERAAGHIPDGYEYRLPTEAEWEYACRAGTTTALPNGRDISILGKCNAPALDDIAWYGGNSSVGFGDGRGIDTSGWSEKQYQGGRAFVREIREKQANRWGLYDMIGNVLEWCGDWYGAYGHGADTDPTGASSGAFRVSRGGGWDFFARNCRSASRVRDSPDLRDLYLGFRVALAPSH